MHCSISLLHQCRLIAPSKIPQCSQDSLVFVTVAFPILAALLKCYFLWSHAVFIYFLWWNRTVILCFRHVLTHLKDTFVRTKDTCNFPGLIIYTITQKSNVYLKLLHSPKRCWGDFPKLPLEWMDCMSICSIIWLFKQQDLFLHSPVSHLWSLKICLCINVRMLLVKGRDWIKWEAHCLTECLLFNFRTTMVNTTPPTLFHLPIAVLCFNPVLKGLCTCVLMLWSYRLFLSMHWFPCAHSLPRPPRLH